MALVTSPPTAATLLRLMSLLAPEPIPAGLLVGRESSLEELERQGLVSIQGSAVTVRPEARDAARSRMEPEQLREDLTLLLQLVNRFAPERPSDPRTWEVWDLLEPHAEALLERTREHPAADTRSVALLSGQLAAFLWAKGRPGRAELLMRRALALEEAVFGREHPNVAIQLNNLGLVLLEMDRLAEAEPLIRRALAIDEAALGAGHPNVAIDLGSLARLLQMTDRLSEAEPLMRRALAIDEASFGSDHPSVARDLNNLAQILQDAGRPHEAEPFMRHSVEIFVRALGPDHPSTRGVRKNLELLLEELGYRHNW